MTSKDKKITELKYEEALNFAIEHLSTKLDQEKISLLTFCKKHKLDYQICMNLRTHPVKRYPTALFKLLSALHIGKVKVQKITVFSITGDLTTNEIVQDPIKKRYRSTKKQLSTH